jgi:hypothetical protein
MTQLGEYPQPPTTQRLPLPGGASLSGMVDLPRGVSEDCRVTFNLMLQLGPFLASMECFVRLMRFVGWLLKFVKVVTNPVEAGKLLTELPPIADDLLECVTAFTPVGICPPIKNMLLLIVRYIECLVEALESVAQQQLEISVQMGDAQGNPELAEALQLASQNSQRIAEQALNAAGPALGMLENLGALLEIVGAGAIAVPSLDQLAGGAASDVIQPLKDIVTTVRTVAEALPC